MGKVGDGGGVGKGMRSPGDNERGRRGEE